MTSPYLLARKPVEEKKEQTPTGQTVREQPNFVTPTQLIPPVDIEPRPLWQQKVDKQREATSLALSKNLTLPAATTLQEGYSNIFPIVKAIGESARAGQTAASETQRVRAAAIKQRELNEAHQKAIDDAYKRLSQIETGAAGPNRNYPGSGSSQSIYSGEVNWDRSDAALADLMRKAGFPESEIGIGLAVAFGESGFREDANHSNPDGSIDLGIFQINSKAHASRLAGKDWTDPWTNVQLAKEVWDERGGSWAPWVVYQNGVSPRAVPTTRLTVTGTPVANGGVYSTGNGSLRNAVVNRAMVVENLPYVWGGESLTTGLDCSGLVYAVYKELGIPIPGRNTADAYSKNGAVGTRVGSVNQLRPGDLVAFQWAGGYAGPNKASHIAIYAGNNQIIEAYGGDHGRRRSLTNSSQDQGAIYLSVRFPGE